MAKRAQTPAVKAAVEATVSDGQTVTVVRFRGGGFLLGVPARDLTAAEWAALTDEQRSAAGWSGLYDFEFGESQEEDGA